MTFLLISRIRTPYMTVTVPISDACRRVRLTVLHEDRSTGKQTRWRSPGG